MHMRACVRACILSPSLSPPPLARRCFVACIIYMYNIRLRKCVCFHLYSRPRKLLDDWPARQNNRAVARPRVAEILAATLPNQRKGGRRRNRRKGEERREKKKSLNEIDRVFSSDELKKEKRKRRGGGGSKGNETRTRARERLRNACHHRGGIVLTLRVPVEGEAIGTVLDRVTLFFLFFFF